MKISIITVVFNNCKTIRNAINSVLNQKYENIEYIIIDGGSNDGTLDIINEYKDSISVIVSELDKGIYDAMNKGIRMASGDVVGFLNSDDLFADPTVIHDVMECFITDSELDILYGNLVYVSQYATEKIVRKWNSKSYCDDFFESGNVPPHPTLYVRSHVYNQAGIFDLQYTLAADYEFMLRIFKKHQFKSLQIQRLIVRMRLGGATNKNLRNILKGNKEILRSWNNNGLKAPFALMPLRIIKRLGQFF
jgi:glycosyltransferase involved in cell wall biosynthesis